ncbi:hypothetical protein HDV01_002109 [Terramyces sp. JEL0728]|nr:hypothetical protein HDV01_002109 [Terramyces sp. JEL0728]
MYLVLDISLVIIFALILVVAVLYFIKVNIRKETVKAFVVEFNCILGFNILQCMLAIIWDVLYYVDINLWNSFQYKIYLVTGVVGSVQLCLIFVTDVEILRVFSILNENITDFKLKIYKICVLSFYAIVLVFDILAICIDDTQIFDDSNYLTMVFAPFVALYDNVQSFYLVYLIYKFKNQKNKSVQRQKLIDQFSKIIKFISFILLMDWIGIACFTASVIDTSELAEYYAYTSLIGLSVHNFGMLHVLNMLAQVSIKNTSKGNATVKVNE